MERQQKVGASLSADMSFTLKVIAVIRLGMGVAYKGGHTFVVANYGPAGNFWRHENSYKDNVLPKIE